MTSQNLSVEEGGTVVKRWYTASITEQFGAQVAHEVTDEAFAASVRGQFESLCGRVFVAAALVAPIGRPCQACLSVLAARRTAASVGAPRPPRSPRLGELLRRLWPGRWTQRAVAPGKEGLSGERCA